MTRSKPRGFFTDQSHLAWSKDKSKNYFEGRNNLVLWPLAKAAAISILLTAIYSMTN